VPDKETLPQPRRPVVITQLAIEVLAGPDRGKRLVGGDRPLSIGTAGDTALVLTDPTVSRYHLEVDAAASGILIADLDSTNGTFAGPVRIERAVVPPGTQLAIGATTLRVDEASRKTVPPPVASQHAGMIATTPQMLQLFADIERVARTPTSILVFGESGTGKEHVAEALHAGSGRSGPLVTIDCGALSSALLASELFGHDRGAFTGADRQYAGAFERAGEGTVFLDEIGELPQTDQTALLGVLERRRFRRVGGSTDLELRARVVAATNRDLRIEVNHGRFRPDLYHRLAVVTLRLPPLRERPDDIPLLVAHFAHELGAAGDPEQLFGAERLARWKRRPWPGNVRELRNAVEAAVVVGHEPAEWTEPGPPAEPAALAPYKHARATNVAAFEQAYITQLMAAADGNVSRAARLGQMDRSYLLDLLQRHKLR